jgi:hypothetical protein
MASSRRAGFAMTPHDGNLSITFTIAILYHILIINEQNFPAWISTVLNYRYRFGIYTLFRIFGSEDFQRNEGV